MAPIIFVQKPASINACLALFIIWVVGLCL